MDEFDQLYADELDALDDCGVIDHGDVQVAAKKSLKFTTPKAKNKTGENDLNTSLELTPIDSPSAVSKDPKKSARNSKRKALEADEEGNDLYRPLSDSEPEEELFPDIEPARKKVRLNGHLFKKDAVVRSAPAQAVTEDDFDITPPPSPDISRRFHRPRRSNSPSKSWFMEGLQSHRLNDVDERPRVQSRIPACNFMSTTGTEGTRVYMKVQDELDLEEKINCVVKSCRSAQLLTTPYQVLRDQIEAEREQGLIEEAERISATLNRMRSEVHNVEEPVVADTEEHIPIEHSLWVEKYAPRKYTDLLSEELINRTLLHWIKLWDVVVFGKEPPVKKEKKKIKENVLKKKKYQMEVSDELDKFNRPEQKVALLSGPPGLGKTTLSHVIASHAGYNVVEMNASDDRTVDAFLTKIEAATQMKSVLTSDPRPNCLIIDEIDGAPQAAINVLLSILKRPEGNKKKEKNVLLRPVICICNDLYVPALRQLRQMALVLTFPPTEPSRLTTRLYEVVKCESMKADTNTLLALCEKTDNDIRSCLNTLQFLRQRHKELSLKIIQLMTVGQKDVQKSLFSVWHEIFTIPKPKRARFNVLAGEGMTVEKTNTLTTRFNKVLETTQSAGEYEKITQGLYENYLEAKFKDPRLEGLNLATEWLCFVDVINQDVLRSQRYTLYRYLPYIAVTFHLLFASNNYPRIQYPHSQFEYRTKWSKHNNLVTSLMDEMVPRVRKFLNPTQVVLDVLPPLLSIIQPTLRPVNTQLYSAREKADMAQLVSIMIAYNMTFHQEKQPEGHYQYVLDPNMEDVVRFPGMKQHRQLTYAAKQLIAREIDTEKMRRSEAAYGLKNQKMVEQPANRDPQNKGDKATAVIPNHKQTLQPVIRGTEEINRPVRDFFGRVVQKKVTESKKAEEKKKNILATDIWFHFQEGFSNAVRRNVRIKDFI